MNWKLYPIEVIDDDGEAHIYYEEAPCLADALNQAKEQAVVDGLRPADALLIKD